MHGSWNTGLRRRGSYGHRKVVPRFLITRYTSIKSRNIAFQSPDEADPVQDMRWFKVGYIKKAWTRGWQMRTSSLDVTIMIAIRSL